MTITSYGPGPEVQPRPAVQEGVGEVEEVAAAGVEVPGAQPVDDHGDGDDQRASRSRPGRAVAPQLEPSGVVTSRASRPARRPANGASSDDAEARPDRSRPGRTRQQRQSTVASGIATAHQRPAASSQATGSEEEHRVVVPQERREELAGDDRDQVARLGASASRAATTTTTSVATTASQLDHRRGPGVERPAW